MARRGCIHLDFCSRQETGEKRFALLAVLSEQLAAYFPRFVFDTLHRVAVDRLQFPRLAAGQRGDRAVVNRKELGFQDGAVDRRPIFRIFRCAHSLCVAKCTPEKHRRGDGAEGRMIDYFPIKTQCPKEDWAI